MHIYVLPDTFKWKSQAVGAQGRRLQRPVAKRAQARCGPGVRAVLDAPVPEYGFDEKTFAKTFAKFVCFFTKP